MLRSNRGAARISAVWMISVGVVALAALAFAFIAQSDLSAVEKQLAAATAAKGDADTRFGESNDAKREVSVLLGWYDRASADPATDVDAAKNALSDLRSTFSDLTDTDTDFELILPKVVAAYDQRGSELAGFRTRIQALEAEVASANASVAQVTAAKDRVIGDLRSQLSDEQQNSADRQQDLEDRLASAQQQVADRDAEVRSLRSAMADATRASEKAMDLAQARILSLSKDLEFQGEDFARNPDGKILEVSETLPLAWIDLGTNNRLARGMRFQVEGGAPGESKVKAWVEVTRVEANRAEVAITDLVDRWSPVVTGDVIVNELYDPHGTRNAVLAGSFNGRFHRPELVAMLGNMGVNVQEELDYSTHFLIVGSTLYNDPETNEPLEEPMSPSELAVYKEAEAQGIQIVPLERIRQFFRFDS